MVLHDVLGSINSQGQRAQIGRLVSLLVIVVVAMQMERSTHRHEMGRVCQGAQGEPSVAGAELEEADADLWQASAFVPHWLDASPSSYLVCPSISLDHIRLRLRFFDLKDRLGPFYSPRCPLFIVANIIQ